ncbi:MAG: hypothetical protein HZB12_02300 [Candidatus Yonathbacteria bacterium]|nr:hypothetical protein [Candidatus Yonathbacteria bacterium]
METIKIHPLSNFIKYKVSLGSKGNGASFLRLAGLISKKEAKKMLETTKKSRSEWR